MKTISLGIAISVALCNVSNAETQVVPSILAEVEGNSNNGSPFNLGPFSCCYTSMRYQQVYNSSEFIGIPVMALITHIRFRPNYQHAPFDSTISDIQINLSTTPAVANGLSTTFANNIGPDDKIVHNGALALSSNSIGPSGGPSEFDIVIELEAPFVYNPSLGNLLLDVRNFTGEHTQFFDAHDASSGTTSRVRSFGVSPLTANAADSLGLVTQFEYVLVPEPSTYALALAALCLAMSGWRAF